MQRDIPTVLHVEDDENDRVLIKIAHQSANVLLNVITVEDGEEAVAYLNGDGAYSDRLRSPMPALVLLDLKLPRKSGFEVLEWIREQQRFVDLPVIVLSSSALESDREKASRTGANSYYVKPVSMRPLIEIIRRIYFECLVTPQRAAKRCGQTAITRAHWVINDLSNNRVYISNLDDSERGMAVAKGKSARFRE